MFVGYAFRTLCCLDFCHEKHGSRRCLRKKNSLITQACSTADRVHCKRWSLTRNLELAWINKTRDCLARPIRSLILSVQRPSLLLPHLTFYIAILISPLSASDLSPISCERFKTTVCAILLDLTPATAGTRSEDLRDSALFPQLLRF